MAEERRDPEKRDRCARTSCGHGKGDHIEGKGDCVSCGCSQYQARLRKDLRGRKQGRKPAKTKPPKAKPKAKPAKKPGKGKRT